MSVRPEVKTFILSLIDASDSKYLRSYEIGRAAYHTEGITDTYLESGESLPLSRYTAWAGVYTVKLIKQGYIFKDKIKTPKHIKTNKKTVVVYKLTAEGTQWLADIL